MSTTSSYPALFFGQAHEHGRAGAIRVVIGQYLGFAAILAASIVGALGAGLLPESVIPYLGLVPLFLGLRAAWSAWRQRGSHDQAEEEAKPTSARASGRSPR